MREQELWKKCLSISTTFLSLSIKMQKMIRLTVWIRLSSLFPIAGIYNEKGLPERKKDITSSEKVVWLDSYEDLKNGNYDVIFKSANTTTFGMKSTLKLCRSEDDERDLRMETKKRHIYAFALQKAKTGFLQFTKAITMA